MSFPELRLRRLRRTRVIREVFRETTLPPSSLVYPIFVDENAGAETPIESMPGQYRLPLHRVSDEVGRLLELGIRATILFGIPAHKDPAGSQAYSRDGIVQRALRTIRHDYGDEVLLIADTCLCEYTSHGHCGLVEDGRVVNDRTLELLAETAETQADAGADIVAPSAMMDGQVAALRRRLDQAGFQETMIMAYSSKHASAFYRPFREAASSKPQFGDRRSHQLPVGNLREALREMEMDVREGADILLIKPALPCLDLISLARRRFDHPIAAYNVSGEYCMVKAAVERGWLDERGSVVEVLTAIRRAGADLVITYHAKEYAAWWREGLEV